MSQVKKNLYFNIITLIVNIGIGFFYTPYLVNSLGIIAYGVIPLALVLSQYISVLTNSLTGALTRFYSVEMQGGNYKQASIYLSSSFIVILLIILITIPLFLYIIININTIFNIPNNLLNSAKILFYFSLVSFYVSLISSFFNIILYAVNRLDLLNKINIIRASLKVLLAVLLFETIDIDFKFIGISNFIAEIVVLGLSLYFFKKLANINIKLKIIYFEKAALLSLGSMAMWTIIHQLGDLAIYKVDILFVNKFWSTKESGILGAVSEFGSYIMIILGVISSLFGPLILIAFSKKNYEEVKRMAINNSLILGLLSSLLVAILIGFSPEFLKLWLGKEFESYASWLSLKLIVLPFYSSAGVFAFVYRSWNKVKYPAIFTLFMGGINVSVLFLICNMSEANIDYINYLLVFTGICTIIQTYVLGIFMFNLIYKEVSVKKMIITPVKFSLVLLVIISVSKLITNFYIIEKWYQLIVSSLFVGVFGLFIIYSFLLNKELKIYIFSLINKNI